MEVKAIWSVVIYNYNDMLSSTVSRIVALSPNLFIVFYNIPDVDMAFDNVYYLITFVCARLKSDEERI